jgi:hypothetical protein
MSNEVVSGQLIRPLREIHHTTGSAVYLNFYLPPDLRTAHTTGFSRVVFELLPSPPDLRTAHTTGFSRVVFELLPIR